VHSACTFIGATWGENQPPTPDQRYSGVGMPGKPTLLLHPDPVHEPEPLATEHSRVIFCVGDDRFAVDFSATVTQLKPRPAELIPIEENRSAKRRRVDSDRRDRTSSLRHLLNRISRFIRLGTRTILFPPGR
jgi:hypothetical protein